MSSHRSSLSGSLLSAVCDSRDKAGTQKEKKMKGAQINVSPLHLIWFKWKWGALQRQPPEREWFCRWCSQTADIYFFFPLIDFSQFCFLLVSLSLLIVWDRICRVTQVVQLFQDNTCCPRKVYYIYQHCLKSVEEIRNRKWAVTRGEPDQYLPFCVRRSSKSAAIALQHDLQQASCACFSWGYKDPILFNGSVLAA